MIGPLNILVSSTQHSNRLLSFPTENGINNRTQQQTEKSREWKFHSNSEIVMGWQIQENQRKGFSYNLEGKLAIAWKTYLILHFKQVQSRTFIYSLRLVWMIKEKILGMPFRMKSFELYLHFFALESLGLKTWSLFEYIVTPPHLINCPKMGIKPREILWINKRGHHLTSFLIHTIGLFFGL